MSEASRIRKKRKMEKERLLNCYQERGLDEILEEECGSALFISSSSTQPDNYKKFSLDRNKCVTSTNN